MEILNIILLIGLVTSIAFNVRSYFTIQKWEKDSERRKKIYDELAQKYWPEGFEKSQEKLRREIEKNKRELAEMKKNLVRIPA